ncbi:glyoxalase/bleomycin resistance/extradiol dioxygenase family protein [Bacillus timonensis]|uniref:Glyoxalase/bleomycin resistance/extradiol dioxygenase family protein n=1 Tax=Bacillus timonensis TaxID=1033734 RepID=A0A4S3PUE1_9BACI|nr:VOC family protein [Bacillus timonensis]THE13005.1 glyoxalase/bleomycin resistance/extradiol dioxygenase family protein [Bacillus timonensis]
MGVQNIFVNLPVKNLEKTMEFFSKLGFEFNPQFTNESATCMVIGKSLYAMLLVEDYFKSFTKKDIPDTTKSAEAIIALSVESREEVDELTEKALTAGAKPTSEPQDHGFMYSRSFADLDGHLWEVFFMDNV